MGRAVALGQRLVAKWMWRTRKISNRQTDNDQLSSPECQCFPTCSGNTPDSPLRWGFTPNSSCSRGISTQPQQVRKLAAAEPDFRLSPWSHSHYGPASTQMLRYPHPCPTLPQPRPKCIPSLLLRALQPAHRSFPEYMQWSPVTSCECVIRTTLFPRK